MKNLFFILLAILTLKSNIAFAQAEGYKLVSVRNQVFLEIPENWKVASAQELKILKENKKDDPTFNDIHFISADLNGSVDNIQIYLSRTEIDFTPIQFFNLKTNLDVNNELTGKCRGLSVLACEVFSKSIGEYLTIVSNTKIYQREENRVLDVIWYTVFLKSNEKLLIYFRYDPANAELVQQIDHIKKSIFIK